MSHERILVVDDEEYPVAHPGRREVLVKREEPERLESLIHLLSRSRHLERIADHATNIAEDVIYMVEGEIVRRHHEKY